MHVLQLHEIIYVTDVGQSQHFNSLFELANKLKWAENTKLTHVGFGLINIDGKKISSRIGKTPSLKQLFESAILKAEEVSKLKTSTNIAYDKCGLNSIKYFDMIHNYKTTYEYDEDRMINFNGNTAIYNMYTYARICNIIKKSNVNVNDLCNSIFTITHRLERDICILMMQLPTVLQTIYKTFGFNILTTYVHNLSSKINSFITNKEGRVIDHEYQNSRLLLLFKLKQMYEIIFNLLNMELIETI